jgi:Ca2+-binding RTX toxin-like protein
MAYWSGTNGDDVYQAGSGDDEMHGLGGNDNLAGRDGADLMYGEDGDDSLYGEGGNDTLYGGGGADGLNGGLGDDFLYGGAGDDVLVLAPAVIGDAIGTDYLDGGDGIDLLQLAFISTGVTINLAQTAQQTLAWGITVTLVNIENATGTDYVDNLYGDSKNNLLVGDGGNDYMDGYAGDDRLWGGFGDDQLHGGEGDDRLDGDEGNDWLYGLSGVDGLYGGDGDDYLLGGYGADIIDGGNGADTLVVEADGGGLDVLFGQAGADTFVISAYGYEKSSYLGAVDTIADFSAAQGDRLSINYNDYRRLTWYGAVTTPSFSLTEGQALNSPAGASVIGLWTWTSNNVTYLIVDSNANQKLDANDVVVAFNGSPSLSLASFKPYSGVAMVGTDGADTWTGTADPDFYYGLGGADQISGGGSYDTLYGNAGDDTIDGGDDSDMLYGGAGSDILRGGAGNDTLLASDENYPTDLTGEEGTVNQLFGEAGDDTLRASAGKDVLDGGDGADTLYGRSDDTLRGGAGDDTLRFESGDKNSVADGGAGNDLLWLASGGHTYTGGSGADSFNDVFLRDWDTGGLSTITDFNAAEGDRLAMSRFGTSVLRGQVDNPNFELKVGQVFSSSDYGYEFTQFWTWSNGGYTYLMVDTDQSGTLTYSDSVVRFTGAVTLGVDAFIESSFSKATFGSQGADVFAGTSGKDVYYGVDGDDQVHGGDDYDQLFGNDGNDQIWGDGGSDVLSGGTGDDVIHGGDGNDTIYGLWLGGYGVDQALEKLYGDGGDDWIQADSNRAELYGGDGADRLYGGALLYGEAGNDTLTGGPNATLYGGDGDDTLSSGSPYNGANTLYGGAGRDTLYGSSGVDTVYADAADYTVATSYGDDIIYLARAQAGESTGDLVVVAGQGADRIAPTQDLANTVSIRINGEDQVDLLDLSAATGKVTVNLGLAGAQQTGMGLFTLSSIENVTAGAFGGQLTGDKGVNVLKGGAGEDVLRGEGGDDILDGGAGNDAAEYSGTSNDYAWLRNADGSWWLSDLRQGFADGIDTLKNIETLKFSDKSIALTANSLSAPVETAFAAILRAPVSAPSQEAGLKIVTDSLLAGASQAKAIGAVIRAAGATTSVASLAYEFFTGKVPGEAGIDYLVSPTGPNANNLNSAYYQSFNLENRYINFAVNLGKVGEGKDAFLAKYGSLSFVDATREAYKTIFGAAPTDAKIHAMIDSRVDYFAAYGGDGPNGVGTKAAMVGWLLAEAQKADLGVMVRSNDAWLTDLADGSAPFAIDILDPAKGYYKADFIFGG